MKDKIYVGDGIYVKNINYGIELTTENGITTTNRIVIELREWKTLNEIVNLWETGDE